VAYHGERAAASSDDEEYSDEEGRDEEARHAEGKEERAVLFAAWLIEIFGRDHLCAGRGVLDVAAGRGQLSTQLCEQLDRDGETGGGRQLRCTMVEPAPRPDTPGTIAPPDVDDSGRVVLLREPFDEGFAARHPALLAGCSVLVGLHPVPLASARSTLKLFNGAARLIWPCDSQDQPTEAIVDAALRLGKVRAGRLPPTCCRACSHFACRLTTRCRQPFAVVPCCVFPSLFPMRRQKTGQFVRGYRGFMRYLKAKDHRIEVGICGKSFLRLHLRLLLRMLSWLRPGRCLRPATAATPLTIGVLARGRAERGNTPGHRWGGSASKGGIVCSFAGAPFRPHRRPAVPAWPPVWLRLLRLLRLQPRSRVSRSRKLLQSTTTLDTARAGHTARNRTCS
jgi:hypothetical protein